MYDEMPIKIYRIVHTIGKTKAGGLKIGLFKEEYMDIFPLKSADMEPMASGIRMEMMSEFLLIFFINKYPFK